LRENLEQ